MLAANRESPDTLAVDDGRLELTYRRLTLLARVMARLVRRETAVDRVGIMLPASAVFPASLFGVLWAGKIAVPLNFLLNPETVAGVVRDSEIDLILTIRHF
ncbi:MAG: AMP-binding protein [Planctomycetes bacterium]|nr:AMP-binding protein [Planctomycetota bacterium]